VEEVEGEGDEIEGGEEEEEVVEGREVWEDSLE
jgi:hypothetical protein